ncbi:type I restriction endonuclease subunit R [Pediococcus damnosus]|uniref:type I restriction endonuclease subunit R n=3 Tax=Pediococcus damnosus TaxID=51663 RepID=UPI000C1CA59F|nr:HsdR family type I site-specific deoxyribonuclease [Pediococcus damnosus]PIO84959.1 restriction endonuclease subunit R [Pediococcus damnosus]
MALYKTKGEIPFENEFIETLCHNGWTYLSELENATPKQLENHFRKILNQNNQDVLSGVDITDKEMEDIMRFISGLTPTDTNRFLTKGYVAEINLTRENPDFGKIQLRTFWRDAVAGGQMHYEIVKQAIRPGMEDKPDDPNRRFDVTLLFNGMPLIQIEEKKVDVSLKHATNQIAKYKSEHKYDGLYSLVQIFVALKEDASRYFANQKSEKSFNNKFFFEWLDSSNKAVRNWKQFTEEFLKIPMAHNIISNFTLVNSENLVVLRPYQIHAVEAIRNAFAQHKDGCVWHATGSGKTMTAYKTATLLQRDPGNQVIFLSDRKELDSQSGKNFSMFSSGSDDNVFEINSTNDLIRHFKSNKTGVIVTTINKMKIAVDKHNARIAEGKKGILDKVMNQRLVFIVDEAHRSQFGEMQRVIKQAFPKQNWYGFTGTPIFEFNKTAQDQTTETQFGPELHQYNIGNALNDGAILKFNSEYVNLAQVTDQDNKEVEEPDLPDDFYDGDSEESDKYRDKVVKWIIKNWQKKSVNGSFNAILATSSIRQALKFYSIFKKKRDNGESKLKVAITYSLNENGDANQGQREGLVEAMKDYSRQYTNSDSTFNLDNMNAYIEDVAKRSARMEGQYRHIKPEESIDLTIVVARLLTGFDAQRLNTLYLDKLMEYQGLIQAYARTNRVFDKNKSQGNIVVFRRPKMMEERTKDAFEKYAGPGTFKKVFRPEFDQMQNEFHEEVDNLRNNVPQPEDANDLQDASQDDQIEFLTCFRSVAKKLQYIASYSEFNWDQQADEYGITQEEYGYYQGAFENIKAIVTESQDEEPDDPEQQELLNFDFEDVVIHELVIDKEYVLTLATKAIQTQHEFMESQTEKDKQRTADAQKKLEVALEKYAKSGHSLTAEQIKNFVNETPVLEGDKDFDAISAFAIRQDRKKKRAILDFCDEWGLDPDQLTRLNTEYVANGKFDHERDLRRTADKTTAEMNGHVFKNVLQYKTAATTASKEFIKKELAKY